MMEGGGVAYTGQKMVRVRFSITVSRVSKLVRSITGGTGSICKENINIILKWMTDKEKSVHNTIKYGSGELGGKM